MPKSGVASRRIALSLVALACVVLSGRSGLAGAAGVVWHQGEVQGIDSIGEAATLTALATVLIVLRFVPSRSASH